MRIFDIAIKDIGHSLRSVFLVVFAFALPLATTAVFFAAFGGLSQGKEPELAAIPVVVANMDEGGQAGKVIADMLASKELSDRLAVRTGYSAEAARKLVDSGEAAVAVIIPQNFSASLLDTSKPVVVEVYQDPAKTVGPAMVRAIVGQAVDGMAGLRVAMLAGQSALAKVGVSLDPAKQQALIASYTGWATGFAERIQGGNQWNVKNVSKAQPEEGSSIGKMISAIMGMMLVFYCFFTGAVAAQSILQEQEAGTLQRLFTTAMPRTQILLGKMLAVLLTLLLEVAVLVVASGAAFGIAWGDPLSVTLAVIATAVLSASFGIFLVSFLRDTKQAGMVYGVVINLVGWVGISRMFDGIIPGMSEYANITNAISLLSPHGWAASMWQASLAGAPVLGMFLGILGIALALFAVGAWRMNRRFAG